MTEPVEVPSAEQLDELANLLAQSLVIGLDEIKRLGNPSGISIPDYTLGCMSMIATIRQMGSIMAAGGDVFAEVPTEEEMEQTLHDLTEELRKKT